jgi:hypothetical protein
MKVVLMMFFEVMVSCCAVFSQTVYDECVEE